MKGSIWLILAPAACSTAFLGAAVSYHRSAREIAAKTLAATRAAGRLDFRAGRLDSDIQAAFEEVAPPGDPGQPPPSLDAAKATRGASFVLQTPTLLDMVRSDPALFGLAAENRRAIMMRKYAPLFRDLGFDSRQIAQFGSLEERHASALVDITAAAIHSSIPLDDPAVTDLIGQEYGRYHDAQRALFGDKSFQQIKEYTRLIPVTKFVEQLAESVAFTDTPLSQFQTDRLSQVFANASSAYRDGGTASESTVDWKTVLAEAQPLLTPEQFEVLQYQNRAVQVYDLEKQFMDNEMAAVSRSP